MRVQKGFFPSLLLSSVRNLNYYVYFNKEIYKKAGYN